MSVRFLFVFNLLFNLFRIALWPSVRVVPLAFHLCCFYFSAVLIVGVVSRLVFGAGFGIRLYRFLIIAFLSTLLQKFISVGPGSACGNHVYNGISR